MSATYADDDYAIGGGERTTPGGVILAIVSSVSALLVILGLFYATNIGHRQKVSLANSDCEATLYISALPCTTRQAVLGQYHAIVNPAIAQLTADAAAYIGNEGHNLAAAESALTAEVATEQALDNSLAAVAFTPQHEVTANSLIADAMANGQQVPSASVLFTPQMTAISSVLIKDMHALIELTAQQARSSSLTQLRSFNSRSLVATVAVQTQLKLLLKVAEVRPTVSQEP